MKILIFVAIVMITSTVQAMDRQETCTSYTTTGCQLKIASIIKGTLGVMNRIHHPVALQGNLAGNIHTKE